MKHMHDFPCSDRGARLFTDLREDIKALIMQINLAPKSEATDSL